MLAKVEPEILINEDFKEYSFATNQGETVVIKCYLSSASILT
jgi:hypothetical protein